MSILRNNCNIMSAIVNFEKPGMLLIYLLLGFSFMFGY